MSRVVVIGAGLTGLVAAERLARSGLSAQVVEREPEPGGACRSLVQDGFTFDLTGHLLHVQQRAAEDYLRGFGLWEGLEVHERRAAVVVGGRITPYPIQIHTHGLEDSVRRDCLLGFIRAWAAAKAAEPIDFRQWVLGRFGEGLARHFFFPYNSKLFRAEPEELSLDWVGRYVPKPDLEEVVDGALGLHRRPVGYNAVFRYPAEGGIRQLPDAIARRVPELELETEVVAVDLADRAVELADGRRLDFEALVSTVSLPALIDLLAEKLPEEISAARRRLRWVRVLNLALGVEGAAPRPEHWLYFADPAIPYYRVGFPSNHGRLAPDGCHTVSVEVSLPPDGGDVAEESAAAERALVGAGLVDRSRVRVRRLSVIDPAYVVFDHARREAVALLRRYLAERGVLIAGRWAEWKYSAMEDAILDGMAVARRVAKALAR